MSMIMTQSDHVSTTPDYNSLTEWESDEIIFNLIVSSDEIIVCLIADGEIFSMEPLYFAMFQNILWLC